MINALLLAAAIVTEVAATLALRASENFTKRGFIVPLVVGYGLSFVLLYVALNRGLAVGIAYGIWAATGVALTAIAGRLIFRDPLTRTMSAGIGLVMAGVFLVEIGAQH